jgi:hypothetical protein
VTAKATMPSSVTAIKPRERLRVEALAEIEYEK